MSTARSIPLTVRSRSWVVIPARLASTRLPRKLLLAETGKPLLQHTFEAAGRAGRPQGLCVAADCEEIAAAVRAFGGEVRLTDPAARSGTDRVAEVARQLPDAEIIVNVQGDEPEIDPGAIDLAIQCLEETPAASMSTLAAPIRCRRQLEDPSCVKVVRGGDGAALYFSRSVVPCPRDWDDALLEANPPAFLQHVGLYAYRRDVLLRLAALPPAPAERIENLEQLRALHHGHRIQVAVVEDATAGIDTPADYRAFVSRRGSC